MHFVDEGAGSSVHAPQTLLFVHGNPTWSFHWRDLILSFRDAYRCIAVDHLGCGLSEKGGPPLRLADRIAHLVELVDRLDLSEITLVAQDWGGAIGLGAALRRRDLFRRILLFNTGAFPPPGIPWRIRACRFPLLGQLAVQGGGLFSRAALRMALARRRSLEPLVQAAYLAPYSDWRSRQAIYDFVMDIPDSTRHPTWRTLEEIESGLTALADLPALLCWGMRDWCFTPACLDRFSAVWPSAMVCRVEGAGHWIVEDAPDEARTALATLLGAAGTFDSPADISRAATHDATPSSR